MRPADGAQGRASPDRAKPAPDLAAPQAEPHRESYGGRFRRMVWDNPTVGPLGGALLTALFALVFGLTLLYAPARFTEGGETAFEQGVIPVAWGYATIGVVSAIALAMAFEPSLRRRRA
ncbi:MAG: hypothetical protein AAF909_10890, partial [Pseudomonadota bacterium]